MPRVRKLWGGGRTEGWSSKEDLEVKERGGSSSEAQDYKDFQSSGINVVVPKTFKANSFSARPFPIAAGHHEKAKKHSASVVQFMYFYFQCFTENRKQSSNCCAKLFCGTFTKMAS